MRASRENVETTLIPTADVRERPGGIWGLIMAVRNYPAH